MAGMDYGSMSDTMGTASTGIMTTIMGAVQEYKAMQKQQELMKAREEMKYEIPQAVMDLVDMSESSYQKAKTSGMPGADLYTQQIQSGTAAGRQAVMEGASSSADIINAISGLQQQEMQGLRQLAVDEANFKQAREAQSQQMYGQSLMTLGGEQKQKFFFEEVEPWQMRYDYAAQQQAQGAATKMAGAEMMATSSQGTDQAFSSNSSLKSTDYGSQQPIYNQSAVGNTSQNPNVYTQTPDYNPYKGFYDYSQDAMNSPSQPNQSYNPNMSGSTPPLTINR